MKSWLILSANDRQEIAIRAALGATSREIVWLVAKRGLVLASAGITLGLAASIALSRVLEGTLFGERARSADRRHRFCPPLGRRCRRIVPACMAGRAPSAIGALRSE